MWKAEIKIDGANDRERLDFLREVADALDLPAGTLVKAITTPQANTFAIRTSEYFQPMRKVIERDDGHVISMTVKCTKRIRDHG